MKRTIYIRMCLLALCTILLTFISTLVINFYASQSQVRRETQRQAMNIAAGYNHAQNKDDFLKDLTIDRSMRITIISEDGRVIFDNFADTSVMENHNTRPEIIKARTDGTAQGTRISDTLGKQTYYYAVRINENMVVRLANTTSSVFKTAMNILPVIACITFFIFIVAIIVANHMTKQIVNPINHIDLEKPLENEVYEEFAPLLSKINNQNTQIEQHMNLLRQKQDEFNSITENMSEGLVLIDSKMNILSANRSAKKLLKAKQKDYSGKNLLMLSRNMAISEIVQNALEGKNSNRIICDESIYLQTFASPVYTKRKTSGCALLILDVSDKYAAEQSRKEFTANVSHELKTPLTSISGYAEMISLGLVKGQDIPVFAQKIHGEVTHLIALIDDIIKLSQLDEKKIDLKSESIDLFELCEEVIERLDIQAKAKNITINLEGEKCFIKGVKHMISELVYNLCNNAVKYNIQNGTVNISIINKENKVILSIADSGIGIPQNEQARIFERFYRVDKSHSKEIDGTGLGLAIVKHIAEYHNAKIEVISKVGKGTQFNIFLKNNFN